MSELVEKAIRIATQAHEGQKRKDGSPYITHLKAVADILARWKFSDTVIAAAYVHDVLEDTSYPKEKLREELGEEVVNIVQSVTEDKALPWEERKANYIESVRRGSEETRAISIADKIHNLESLLAIHATEGRGTWPIFNRSWKEKLWFETSMLAMFKEKLDHPLISQYEALVERMKGIVE